MVYLSVHIIQVANKIDTEQWFQLNQELASKGCASAH